MIRKSLTAKLFLFVLIIFVTQLILQYGFTNYFLADFYESEKIATTENTFYETIDQFKETDDLMLQAELLYEYMEMTNEPILVFNEYLEYHQSSYLSSFKEIVTIEVNGENIVLPFNISDISQFDDLDINMDDVEQLREERFNYDLIGEKVWIFAGLEEEALIPYGFEYEGVFFDSYLFEPLENLQVDPDLVEQVQDEDFIELEGTIVDISERLISDDMVKKIEDLNTYYFNKVFETFEEDDEYNYIMDEVEIKGRTYTFLSALSLQPINEVLAIQSRFQLYLSLAMILLIAIVAYIFSRLISKPIISIAHSTEAIAALNFDVTCDENRSDEIGILGKSVNSLSSALKEKIDTLEDEIEFERRQEKIRREFVADVSHELKTPLGVIRSYSEGIKDGISKERAAYYLDVIIDEVDKMNGLVLDMLELSNLESGKVLSKEKINIKRMVSNLLRSYDQVIEEMDVTITLEDVVVEVDIKKMELVISNLLANAFRYVDDKKIIRIVLTQEELVIENSHEAIEAEQINKLWDRFYRLEKSRSRTFGGNGLGLAIVQKTLLLHELDFGIENSDLGFLFKIRF